MKKWADAAKTYKVERDSLASELRYAHMAIMAKDTVITKQDQLIGIIKAERDNNNKLYYEKTQQFTEMEKLMTYHKSNAEFERRRKKLWRGISVGLALFSGGVLLIK